MERTIAEFRPSTRRWLLGSFAGWGTLCLALVGIGVVMIAMRWWRNLGYRYELTNQRLKVKRGVLLKSEDEIELYRIKDLRVNHSLLNQMAGIGTISIVSSDATTRGGEYHLTDVPDAIAIREKMRNVVEASRGRRGVREYDTY